MGCAKRFYPQNRLFAAVFWIDGSKRFVLATPIFHRSDSYWELLQRGEPVLNPKRAFRITLALVLLSNQPRYQLQSLAART